MNRFSKISQSINRSIKTVYLILTQAHLHALCETFLFRWCGLRFAGVLWSTDNPLQRSDEDKGTICIQKIFFILLKSLSQEKLKFDTIILFLIWPWHGGPRGLSLRGWHLLQWTSIWICLSPEPQWGNTFCSIIRPSFEEVKHRGWCEF